MPQNKKPRTADLCRELALPVLDSLGLALWDIRFEKEGQNWYLRYFIDKPGGVKIDDCEKFSRAIDTLLDEADPIEQSYILEVSSPGIERKLTRDEHFAAYIGARIHIRLIRPMDGNRDFYGELLSCEDGAVSINREGGETQKIPKGDIASVKLCADNDTTGGLN